MTPTRELVTAREAAARGKAARAVVPRSAHAEFSPYAGRDPVQILAEQSAARVPELVPVRHGRMAVSPFTFYRGSAAVMAAELAHQASPGLRTQLCGDAHLANFGAYASAERRLVFDINDFDETLPGPFDWDVKRLAASLVVACDDNGLSRPQARRIVLAALRWYRTAIRKFARMSILDVWYADLSLDDALDSLEPFLVGNQARERERQVRATERIVHKARKRSQTRTIDKLTTTIDGHRRFIPDPPLIVPIDDVEGIDPVASRHDLVSLVAQYRATLPAERRHLFDHFGLTDVCHKVVGVGSVGTRAWILLFEGTGGVAGDTEAIILQAKQAQESVLAPYAGASQLAQHGERVVAGQRFMQASSDIFLGWVNHTREDGTRIDYYVRQLRDWKMSLQLDRLTPDAFATYAQLCGWTLARAHARSGDRIAIASYLGGSEVFDHAVADFAEAYADQTIRDHAAFTAAIAQGQIESAQVGQ